MVYERDQRMRPSAALPVSPVFAREPKGALRRAARGLCLATLILGQSGCDRSEPESARTGHCASFCQALETCDDGTDLLDCKTHCGDDDVRSDRYFQARAQCAKESCNLWVDEVDSQGDDQCTGDDCFLIGCIDHELAEVKLTEPEQRACNVMGTALSNCDSALDSKAIASECKRISPSLSPGYRDDSQLCAESACAEIQSCIDDLAEQYDTDLKVFTGTVTR